MTEFVPHRFCLLDSPLLLWTIGGSDLVIGAAYAVIGAYLFAFARRLKLSGWLLWFYAMFIGFCGLGHDIDFLTLWRGWYELTAIVGVLTAGLSVVSACITVALYYRMRQVADG